jgi:glycosyltransferase involved in cell wall biosynthesis
MKILLVNHGDAGNWGGGDSVQINETAKRLRQRGNQVVVQNSNQPDVGGADLVHIFNSRVQHAFPNQIAACKAQNKPIVISPIWINLGRALWGSRGCLPLLEKAVHEGEAAVERELQLLQQRKLVLEMPEGKLEPHGHGSYAANWHGQIPGLMAQADGVLANSWLELKAVQSDLNWCGQYFNVAHYGVDPKLFLDADPEPFRDYTGIRGPFVLQAGRVEPGKNQAMLCWALRESKLPIVLIGGTKHWPKYADLCKKISNDRLTLIDHLPQHLLASAYAAARVHSLVSWMDTCGLVSLEAALSGTPVVGSSFGHELEYLERDAWLADPADPSTISRAIHAAWEAGPFSERPLRLKKKILERFNWERTVDETEKLYREVLSARR